MNRLSSMIQSINTNQSFYVPALRLFTYVRQLTPDVVSRSISTTSAINSNQKRKINKDGKSPIPVALFGGILGFIMVGTYLTYQKAKTASALVSKEYFASLSSDELLSLCKQKDILTKAINCGFVDDLYLGEKYKEHRQHRWHYAPYAQFYKEFTKLLLDNGQSKLILKFCEEYMQDKTLDSDLDLGELGMGEIVEIHIPRSFFEVIYHHLISNSTSIDDFKPLKNMLDTCYIPRATFIACHIDPYFEIINNEIFKLKNIWRCSAYPPPPPRDRIASEFGL